MLEQAMANTKEKVIVAVRMIIRHSFLEIIEFKIHLE
jgi:hypothetical protein